MTGLLILYISRLAKRYRNRPFDALLTYEVMHSSDYMIKISVATNFKEWRYHIRYTQVHMKSREAKTLGFSFTRDRKSDKLAIEKAKAMHEGEELENLIK